MKPTKEQIAEAAKRGIVPGATIRSAMPSDYTYAIVPPVDTWESGRVNQDDIMCYGPAHCYIKEHGKWATVIKPAPAKRKTASQPRVKGRFAKKPKEPTQLDGLTLAQYQPFQQEVLRLAREAIHDGMVAYSAAVKHQNSEIKRLSAQITTLQSDVSRIESSVAVIRSANTLLGAMDKDLADGKFEPQGLQPGDYCDASKEVADELTAMGWGWYGDGPGKSKACRYISQGEMDPYCMKDHSDPLDTHLDAPTFLARARVTAKELGLKPAQEPQPDPWVPKVNDPVVFVSSKDVTHPPDGVGYVRKVHRRLDWSGGRAVDVEFSSGLGPYWLSSIRPATLEEVAAHLKAEQRKQWKPKFGDRVMTPRGDAIYWKSVIIFDGSMQHAVILDNDDTFPIFPLDQLTPIEP
jgi:hypothetical protein